MNDTPLLKQHRAKSEKSQADIASIVAGITDAPVNQSQISRWEDDPGSIPAKMVRALAQALGVSVEALFEAPIGLDDMAVDAGDPYGQLRKNVGLLRAYLDATTQTPTPPGVPAPGQVDDLCRRVSRKPNVVLAGHFDAGKSRLCNALLGREALPTSYRPTTAAATWLLHVDDRPDFAGSDSVHVFKAGFDPLGVADRDTYGRYIEKCGGMEILASYVMHQERRGNETEYTVVVFLDAPLLKACNLVDLPGHQNKEIDEKIALAALNLADVLVYLSTVTGFLNASDMVHLRARLRQLAPIERFGLPPLSNFLLVVSHAHPNIKDADLKHVLTDGAVTLMRELGETVFRERADRTGDAITLKHVQDRIFPFWFETPDRRDQLREAVRKLLHDQLPQAWLPAADEQVDEFREGARGACDRHIAQYRKALEDIAAAKADLERRRLDEARRKQERDRQRQAIERQVVAEEEQCVQFVHQQFAQLVNDEAVERFITRRYNDKKDAQKYAAGALIDVLQSRVAEYNDKRSKVLSENISAYLGQFDATHSIARPDGSAAVEVAFDAKGVFLGSMAGLGTLGALGAWAASLGNLGGYIIVSKVAGLLASLGIGLGGSSALVSFVAGLGGPAVIGVAVAAAVGWLVSALFGDSWQKRLGHNVVQHLRKHDVHSKFETGVGEYWRSTGTAFRRAADDVEKRYAEQIAELTRIIDDTPASRTEIEGLLARIQKIRDFFAGLPWKDVS